MRLCAAACGCVRPRAAAHGASGYFVLQLFVLGAGFLRKSNGVLFLLELKGAECTRLHIYIYICVYIHTDSQGWTGGLGGGGAEAGVTDLGTGKYQNSFKLNGNQIRNHMILGEDPKYNY